MASILGWKNVKKTWKTHFSGPTWRVNCMSCGSVIKLLIKCRYLQYLTSRLAPVWMKSSKYSQSYQVFLHGIYSGVEKREKNVKNALFRTNLESKLYVLWFSYKTVVQMKVSTISYLSIGTSLNEIWIVFTKLSGISARHLFWGGKTCKKREKRTFQDQLGE